MAEKGNIYDKLEQVQQTLKAPKNQYNSFGKYHYRSCEDILEGLKEPLIKVHAVVTISDEIISVGDRIYVKATARFTDGTDVVENTAYAREELEKKGMDASQITGAASSYARKYALNGLFLIDDNKDADALNKGEEKPKTTTLNPKRAEQEKIAEQKIGTAKINALTKKCEDCGINPSYVAEKCGVKEIADLTEKKFAWLLQNWTAEIVNGVQGNN